MDGVVAEQRRPLPQRVKFWIDLRRPDAAVAESLAPDDARAVAGTVRLDRADDAHVPIFVRMQGIGAFVADDEDGVARVELRRGPRKIDRRVAALRLPPEAGLHRQGVPVGLGENVAR